MENEKQQGNITDHLANERTFLAWVGVPGDKTDGK